MAKCGAGPTSRAVEAWARCLERRREAAPLEGELDAALSRVLPRAGASSLDEEGLRLVLGSGSFGAADDLPDDVVLGWAPTQPASEDPAGYDDVILKLLEAGFRLVAEAEASPFRLLRARRDGYRIRSYRLGDEESIVDLFRDTFGTDLSPRRWGWRYLDNPHGGPRVSLAFSPAEELVCQYCAYPVRWTGLPEAVPAEAQQVGDTMTRVGARGVGRGPTSLLARTARHFYLRNCLGKVAFNYGFNSGNIQKFSSRFLGVDSVEDVPRRELAPEVRPLGLRPGADLSRRSEAGPGYQVRRIADPELVGADFDLLFERVRHRYGLLVERSAAYLRWRYLDCPEPRPELIAVYNQGQLSGWIATARMDDRVEWGDALVDPEELPALAELLDEARVPRLPIVGWFTDRPDWLSKELDALGFVRRRDPDRLVTGAAPFVCGDAVARLREAYYTKADSDLF